MSFNTKGLILPHATLSERYVQKLERNWNNLGCIRVENSLKFVNFKASLESLLIKSLK